jgi:hypothetical protein|tara:strand:- start:535 stop:795 length:261 start_codon:yes stop_codon:yes gene_type:complete
MGKLIDKTAEYLDNLVWKLSPHPTLPTGEPVCNISNEANEWNKRALEYAWQPGNGLVPYRRKYSQEKMQKMQEKTYELNRQALELC